MKALIETNQVTTAVLRYVALALGQDDTRIVLHNMHLIPNPRGRAKDSPSAMLWATDGRRLHYGFLDRTPHEEKLVAGVLDTFAYSGPNDKLTKARFQIDSASAKKIVMAEGVGNATGEGTTDLQSPDPLTVLGNKLPVIDDEAEVVSLNWETLAKMSLATGSLFNTRFVEDAIGVGPFITRGKGHINATIQSEDKDSPTRIDFTEMRHLGALLMPMRNDDGE